MLPLHTHARVDGIEREHLLKVLSESEARSCDIPSENQAIWVDSIWPTGAPLPTAIISTKAIPDSRFSPAICIQDLRNPRVVSPGDVIRVRPDSSLISVLYRRGANANSLFVTEQCNNLCLMCSQPPRNGDDEGLVREVLELIPLVDKDELQLGLSGGEPTLLGEKFIEILRSCQTHLPTTGLHVLTNGRRFADETFSKQVYAVNHPDVTWGIPIYSDVSELHDYVVQARGAFYKTMHGLYNLAKRKAEIEIRIVLHQQTIPRLNQLSRFIFRNLPFVKHVAFMGLEPIGFAKVNRELLWIDPVDYAGVLEEAAYFLINRGLNVSIYNLPLCVISNTLWPVSRKSISDWKNVYVQECRGCTQRENCGGFFASVGRGWLSRGIRALSNEKATSSPFRQGERS